MCLDIFQGFFLWKRKKERGLFCFVFFFNPQGTVFVTVIVVILEVVGDAMFSSLLLIAIIVMLSQEHSAHLCLPLGFNGSVESLQGCRWLWNWNRKHSHTYRNTHRLSQKKKKNNIATDIRNHFLLWRKC